MIYLDNASSTPLLPEVRAAMAPWLESGYANPSSLHAEGRRARRAVEDAREQVAVLLGADPKELLFTSCATESNALALAGVTEALRPKGDHVVMSAIEHPSVLETGALLERRGLKVTRVPVGPDGIVDPADVAGAVTPRTVLVSIMWVNNEIGTVQPIPDIRRAVPGVILHTDAAQAVGKVPVEVKDVDLLTLSAHKMHGPKGVGALWVRRGVPLVPQMAGGGQEFERRSGTENVAGIAGLAAAMGIACRDLGRQARAMAALRDRLQEGLLALEPARLHGDPDRRAPHIASISFEHVDGEAMILSLDAAGICVSSGSACASMSMKVSHVLAAMGVDPDVARGSVRFSLSGLTTREEVDEVVAGTAKAVERLRRISPTAS